MHDNRWMEWWTGETDRMSVETCIMRWTEKICLVYTGAQVRWARIMGRRWEFLGGNSPDLTFNTVRMPINNRIGLCLSNAGPIDKEELDTLKDSIGQSLDSLLGCQ